MAADFIRLQLIEAVTPLCKQSIFEYAFDQI